MSEYDLWNPLLWDILPGYRLLRARRRYHAPCNSKFEDVRFGDWGLHRGDSVEFHWRVQPLEDPAFEMSEADEDRLAKEDASYGERCEKFLRAAAQLRRELSTNFFGEGEHFMAAYSFVRACKKAGWRRKRHGDIYHWFLHRIGSTVASNSGYTDPRVDVWLAELATKYEDFKLIEEVDDPTRLLVGEK